MGLRFKVRLSNIDLPELVETLVKERAALEDGSVIGPSDFYARSLKFLQPFGAEVDDESLSIYFGEILPELRQGNNSLPKVVRPRHSP